MRKLRTSSAAALIVVVAAAQSGSLSVAGPHQLVSTLDGPALVPAQLTLECWFKFAGVIGNSYYTLVRKPESPPSYLLRLTGVSAQNLEFYLRVNGNQLNFSAQVFPVVGQWHHAAATYDGAVIRLYFDGVQVSSLPFVGSASYVAGPMRIGDGASNENATFNGLIDELRLWNYARTASQIQVDRFRSLVAAPGLVSAWKFDGDFQDTAGPFEGTGFGATISPQNAPIFESILSAPSSVPLGGPCAWRITTDDLGSNYYFDMGLSGSSPGTLVGGVTIPVNRPWIFFDYGAFLPPEWFRDFYGVVGVEPAAPVFMVPAIPQLGGMFFSACAVTTSPDSTQIYAVSALQKTQLVAANFEVTSVNPATGPMGGGTQLTLSGTGFVAGSTVLVDGVVASVTGLSPSAIDCVTPPGFVGPAIVSVKAPSGLTATIVDAFSYVPTLYVLGIEPAQPSPGTVVALTGEAFEPSMSVSIGGVPVVVNVVSPQSATFISPASAPCDVVVSATRVDGQSASITWNPTPRIDWAYYAQSGVAGGGTFLLLGAFPSDPTVNVGGAAAAVLYADPGVVIGVAPPGPVGPSTLTLSSSSGCSASTGFTYY